MLLQSRSLTRMAAAGDAVAVPEGGGGGGAGAPYSVDFTALTANENPISLGGLWNNSLGGPGGLSVSPNKDMLIRLSADGSTRICCEDGATPDYDDSLAVYPGGYTGDQRVVAVIYKEAGYAPNLAPGIEQTNHELQIHVGITLNGDGTKRCVEIAWNDQGGYFAAGFNGGLTSWGPPNDSIWPATGGGGVPADFDVFTVEFSRSGKTIKAWQNTALIIDLQWNTVGVINEISQAWMNNLGSSVGLAALRRVGAAAVGGKFGFRSVSFFPTLLGGP